MILKIHHWLFSWYYEKVSDHFKQWTFKKSVDLLRQHYVHEQFLTKSKQDLIDSIMVENEKLRKENLNMKMQLTANDNQIDFSNNKFGTDFRKSTDN